MKSFLVTRFAYFAFLIAAGILGVQWTNAQSTLLDLPTPVSTNELSGTIKPRDVGDARVTTYYYWFEGSQGDVFVNLVTKNLAGDIDVFIQNGLKPLTKIVVYPDFGEVETGRVIYLRKPERLLLRVQGRTPNDEAAQFRIKFAGSFVAVSGQDDPEIPKVISDVTGSVRVNSVGTILPPLPRPVKVETQSAVTALEDAEKKHAETEKAKSADDVEARKSEPVETKEAPKLEVVVTDETSKETTVKTPVKKTPPPRTTRTNRAIAKKPAPKDAPVSSDVEKKETGDATPAKDVEAKESKADPLANVQLVIVFKDGARIERPLTEVLRFSVDGAVLTVISKTGRIGKYSMIDVAKVTIE